MGQGVRALDVHVAAGKVGRALEGQVQGVRLDERDARLRLVPGIEDHHTPPALPGTRSQRDESRSPRPGDDATRFEVELEHLVATPIVELPLSEFAGRERDRLGKPSAWVNQGDEVGVVLYERQSIADPRQARAGTKVRGTVKRRVRPRAVPERPAETTVARNDGSRCARRGGILVSSLASPRAATC